MIITLKYPIYIFYKDNPLHSNFYVKIEGTDGGGNYYIV